jgi:16S rRNA (uracil1498-N3)-methyltransferase
VTRFFVPPGTVAGERLAIPSSIEHQVRRVLRLRDGAEITLLEGDGVEVRCRIAGGALVVIDRRPAGGEPGHRLTVLQALLKGDRLEAVVRHGTELGVARFGLVVTERCVVRDVTPRRLERLRAIAREAAEQSERATVPEVVGPRRLTEVLDPTVVVLLERRGGQRLSELKPPAAIVIGPEGGFSDDEVVAAEGAGAAFASLGPRILRSESVALAAAAVILSRTGDFA